MATVSNFVHFAVMCATAEWYGAGLATARSWVRISDRSQSPNWIWL